MKQVFLGFSIFCFSLTALNADFPAFEKADALYRRLNTFLVGRKGHVGLYVNSDALYEQKSGKENLKAGVVVPINNSNLQHGVVQADGEGPFDGNARVLFISFDRFLEGAPIRDYWGAYDFNDLTADQRRVIVQNGLRQLDKGYGFFRRYKGPDRFRCDGFVEFAYERAQRNIVPDNRENFWVAPNKQKNYLQPSVVTSPTCNSVSIELSSGRVVQSKM